MWGDSASLCSLGTLLAWDVIIHMRKDRGFVRIFFFFLIGVRVYMDVFNCVPRVLDETPEGPEEFGWNKSRHTCIRICVQSTHVCIYAGRRDLILDYLCFFCNHEFFFLPSPKKRQRKKC